MEMTNQGVMLVYEDKEVIHYITMENCEVAYVLPYKYLLGCMTSSNLVELKILHCWVKPVR